MTDSERLNTAINGLKQIYDAVNDKELAKDKGYAYITGIVSALSYVALHDIGGMTNE